MERRSEDRFPVSSPAALFLPEDSARAIPCQLVNVSGSGLRILASDDLAAGRIAVLDLEHHLLAVEVRNAHPVGEKFSIGLVKIAQMEKTAGVDLERQIEHLLREAGLLAIEEPVISAAPPAKETSLDTAAPYEHEVLEAEPRESESPAAARPRARWPLIATAALLAVAIGAIFYVPSIKSKGAATPPAAPIIVEAIPAAPAPAAASTPTGSAPPAAAPSAIAPPATAEHTIFRITARETSWIAVNADGKPVLGKQFARGESQTLEFRRFAFVHIGNAPVVDVTMNNQTLGPFPNFGALRLLQLTPRGARVLPWRNDDPSAPVN